jgi:trehalose synthase
MAKPKAVQIPPQPLDRYEPLLGEEFAQFERIAVEARRRFAGRAIWHISSTARGGGVAEMLRALLPYVRGAGVDTRWMVLRERPEFFAVTKRIHNNLHGDPGDGGELGEEERHLYEHALAASGGELVSPLRAGDVVYLHDPQTAGLVPAMKAVGVDVVWRCHVGADEPNELVRRAWDFLRPYVGSADAYVFSRRQYVWDGLDAEKAWVMPPTIDPFCSKNEGMGMGTVEAILGEIGIAPRSPEVAATFTRGDGSPGRVERRAELTQEEPVPLGAKLVVQVSRWDRLKDHLGLLECFAAHIDDPAVHLVLAGPADGTVSDDPEGEIVYEELIAAWQALPEEIRHRAHLVCLPMDDLEENGAMVNALQRRADVVVQKSIAEGFGMTVSEAMWKERPVVASRVGGIQDQIVDGESGVLVDDPHDLEGFGRAIVGLLEEPERAGRIGGAARNRVMERYLGIYRLRDYVELVASLVTPPGGDGAPPPG